MNDGELQNPGNWDWENAEEHPGLRAEREMWREKGVTWTDNVKMRSVKASWRR